MRDGTFGTTGRCPPFETELVQALESHSFEPLKVLQWRNTVLDFSSIGALQASLAETPKENGLTRAPIAEDILVLEHSVRDDEVRGLAKTPAAIARLWEVCQVPDYRKISPASHAELAMTLYSHLMRGPLPTDWFAQQVAHADHDDGEIDALSNRIAHIRTWTFAANRPDWLADPEHWQGVTRAVEDKLSDALHERLTARFVDRRTSVLMRRMRESGALETDISKTGEVMVEGHPLGRLDGFMFTPDASAAGSEAKTLARAAQKALAGEINARAGRVSQATDQQFLLASDGLIRWQGQPVGRLVAAEEVLKPRVQIIADEHLTGAPRDSVQARLDGWLKKHIETVLAPLFQLAGAEDITGLARGVAFQLNEALGVIERGKIADDVKSLDQPARASLRKYGVRFGAYHIYIPALLKPAPRALATRLYALKHDGTQTAAVDTIAQLAASGRTSIMADKDIPPELYRLAGFRVCGERAVRVDILERIADIIRPALAWRSNAAVPKPAAAAEGFGFVVTSAMTSLAGCSGEEFSSVLRALGYRMEKRVKPAEVVAPSAEPAPAENAPAEVALVETEPAEAVLAETAAAESAEPAVSAEPAMSAEPAPELTPPADVMQETVVEEIAPVVADAVALPPPGEQAATAAADPAPPVEQPADAAMAPAEKPVEDSSLQVAAPASEEQQFIEVWRPGRPEGQRRPRGPSREQNQNQNRRRPPRRPQVQAPAPAAAGDSPPVAVATDTAAAPAEAAAAPAPERQPWRRKEERSGAGDRPERGPRPPQGDSRDRPARPDRPRRDRSDRAGRSDRPEHDPALRSKYIKGRAGGDSRDRRDQQPPDPNSPFAKLAALKAQLEANKEPS
jgi:ATP-dependent RNA helicase SUPV3L1/SUV3